MNGLDPTHLRIYKNLVRIKSPITRVQMIQTLLASQEYVVAFKQANLYSHLLQYVSTVQNNERPPLLPGERTGVVGGDEATRVISFEQRPNGGDAAAAAGGSGGNTMLTMYSKTAVGRKGETDAPYKRVIKNGANKKAMSYFSSCLAVLDLQEEVALTEETLRAAYKKAATRAHPDKGGTEEQFDAVTRAYAYLTDILHRIHGGRAQEGHMDNPANLATGRNEEAKQWETVEPVRLNPKNLNMTTFNQMFEATRMPDPDDEGYGDWLRNEKEETTAAKTRNFSGQFNRDVFHRMFEEEARGGAAPPAAAGGGHNRPSLAIMAIEPQLLAPSMGVELGRDRPADYTAANDSRLQYTDLRNAYTKNSTFSGEVANVTYGDRTFAQVQGERKEAPAPLQDEELRAISMSEDKMLRRESARKVRAAEHDRQAESYFERIKRLVVTDEKPLSITDR